MKVIRNRRLAEQVKRFRARFAQSAGSCLAQTIPAASLQAWVKPPCGHWRERLYGPLPTLKLFLDQVLSADLSCQDAVCRALSERVAQGAAPCSLNSASYCAARRRLPLARVARVAQEIGLRLQAQQPASWPWRGRSVIRVDGTTVSMPDTPANQARYPQSGEQQAGLGVPLARLVALISLTSGAVRGWAVGACKGQSTRELALLHSLTPHLKRGDVLMADRLYAGYFTLAHRAPLGVDRVMRQQARRKTDFRRGQRWARGDHVVTWPRPKRPPERSEEFYAKLPETLSMREIRYRVRQLIAQAAYAAGCLPRLLSFKTALQALRAFEQTLRQAPGKRAHIMIAFLLGAIAQQKLPQRPGRAEPRARKRRQKKAPLMMRPRATLKAILMRKNRQMMRDAFA